MIRKLILTSVLLFVYPGTPSQLITATSLGFALLVFTGKMQPFISPSVQTIHMFALTVQLFTLFCTHTPCSFGSMFCNTGVSLVIPIADGMTIILVTVQKDSLSGVNPPKIN